MKNISALIISVLCVAGITGDAAACTSLVAAPGGNATGRPLIWKHRDTDAPNNFLARVNATDSTLAYVGLFNAGDSLLREAWTGMNESGFAIMNTASYNLAPDTARLKDREGAVMTAALRRCRRVDDFERLLGELPKPLGVQANFGVIDADGHAAYFETSDHAWQRYDASPDSLMIRTNFSYGGAEGKGSGYIRHETARRLISGRELTPRLLIDTLSRSFYHSLTGHDYMAEGERYVFNRDFIPRDITTASIVIVSGPDGPEMWAALGYTPCAVAYRVTMDDIPAVLGPDLPGARSSACRDATDAMRAAIPFSGGSGPYYLDLDVLRPPVRAASQASQISFR